MKVPALWLPLLALIGGCASAFNETHFFRSVDRRGRSINYYRIDVCGQTFLSSSRYLSGYFDEQAVNTYFNEYTQPEKARLQPANLTTPAATQPSDSATTTTLQPLASGLNGTRLVLILSSNSDEIATGISTLAQSNDVAQTLTALASRDKRTGADKASADSDFTSGRAKVLADQGSAAFTAIGDSGDRDITQPALLHYAEDLATFLVGNTVRFKNLQEADDWLRLHQTGRD